MFVQNNNILVQNGNSGRLEQLPEHHGPSRKLTDILIGLTLHERSRKNEIVSNSGFVLSSNLSSADLKRCAFWEGLVADEIKERTISPKRLVNVIT